MILNRIILKNPNNNKNNISPKINSKGFQPLQNTSNVSTSNIQQNNNIFNEIKTENLKDEIHKIINTSSSFESGRRKRKKQSDSELNKNLNKEDNNINKEMNEINKEEKKEENNNIININKEQLEKEIQEQIKKYVIEEHNT